MSPRAPALPSAQRRRSIIDAALPLVLERGRDVTTREIATAAAIAEGTVFRCFARKEDLFDALVAEAFDMEPYIAALESLEEHVSLDDLLVRVAQLQLDRFAHVFRLMSVLRLQGPPPHHPQTGWLERIAAAHCALLHPHRAELRVPPREVMRYVRLLAFSGSNPHITDGRPLTALEIARLVLDGARKAV